MNSILLEGVTDSMISQAINSMCAEAWSIWETHQFEDLLQILPEGQAFSKDELSVQEMDLPFLSSKGIVQLKVFFARGSSVAAIDFLVRSERKVLLAPDVDRAAIVEFLKSEYLGHQVDLRWLASQLPVLSRTATWTLWTGLPQPLDGRFYHLFLGSNEACEIFFSKLSEIIDVSSNASDKRQAVRFVDAENELLKYAEFFD